MPTTERRSGIPVPSHSRMSVTTAVAAEALTVLRKALEDEEELVREHACP